jgi:hypothetical protein
MGKSDGQSGAKEHQKQAGAARASLRGVSSLSRFGSTAGIPLAALEAGWTSLRLSLGEYVSFSDYAASVAEMMAVLEKR